MCTPIIILLVHFSQVLAMQMAKPVQLYTVCSILIFLFFFLFLFLFVESHNLTAWISIANERDSRLNHTIMIIKTHNNQHKDDYVSRRLNNFWLCAVFILHYQLRCILAMFRLNVLYFFLFVIVFLLCRQQFWARQWKEWKTWKTTQEMRFIFFFSHIFSWKWNWFFFSPFRSTTWYFCFSFASNTHTFFLPFVQLKFRTRISFHHSSLSLIITLL